MALALSLPDEGEGILLSCMDFFASTFGFLGHLFSFLKRCSLW